MNTHEVIETIPRDSTVRKLTSSVGRIEADAEDAALSAVTSGVLRFSVRHPVVYGLLAFVIGGGVVSLFTMSTYAWWVHLPIDVPTALYQTVLGGLAGGIALVILAFVYRGSVASVVTGRRRAR